MKAYIQKKEAVAVNAVFSSFHCRHRGPSTDGHKDMVCCVVHSLYAYSLGPNEGAVLHPPNPPVRASETNRCKRNRQDKIRSPR